MRPKDEGTRSTADAERHFIGLVREGQMSTVLPGVRYLSQDELRVIFSLAVAAVRHENGSPQEAEALSQASPKSPGVTPQKPKRPRASQRQHGEKFESDWRQ